VQSARQGVKRRLLTPAWETLRACHALPYAHNNGGPIAGTVVGQVISQSINGVALPYGV
jgi:hypothetical protein